MTALMNPGLKAAYILVLEQWIHYQTNSTTMEQNIGEQ